MFEHIHFFNWKSNFDTKDVLTHKGYPLFKTKYPKQIYNEAKYKCRRRDIMKIKELKVLNMTEPCGIGDSPYFSWIIESDRQDTVQTVYSLVVKSSNSVVWDTGKVECRKTVLSHIRAKC